MPSQTLLILALAVFLLGVAACASGGEDRQQASARNGCGMQQTHGTTTGSIIAGGILRSYRLHVPMKYDPDVPAALVVNLHGYGSNARDQETYSEMVQKANAAGFVTVAPDGSNDPQRWHVYGTEEAGFVDDVAFIRALLDFIEATHCIDPDRIYVAGISNGAAMSIRLACDLNGRIAAIAAVAGVYAQVDCPGERPVPLIAFHGTGDELVPFDAGRAGRYSVATRGVRVAVADWAERNGCQREATPERKEPDILIERYLECKDDADVVLYVVEDGGHTWPGSRINVERFGTTTRTISATELIWQFFESHPRKQ